MEQETPPYPAHYRAGDADRQKVADQLRQALEDGRLTLTEYDERLGAAYGAQTFGELAPLTKDLPVQRQPVVPPPSPAPVEQQKLSRDERTLFIRRGTGWLGGASIMTGIWGIQSFTDNVPGAHFFWPLFPLAFWGVGVLGGTFGRRKQQDRHGWHGDRHHGRRDGHRRRL